MDKAKGKKSVNGSSSSARPKSATIHTPGPASADFFDDTMPPLSKSMMDELDIQLKKICMKGSLAVT